MFTINQVKVYSKQFLKKYSNKLACFYKYCLNERVKDKQLLKECRAVYAKTLWDMRHIEKGMNER